jgi:hypothetical protein
VIYRVFVILLPLKFHPKLFLHHKSLYPDIVSILEEQVNFFEKLFTSEGWDSDLAAYLLNNLEKKLSQEDKEICIL